MRTALFSVGYAGLWGQSRLDLPTLIPHAARLGYRSLMLMGKRPHFSPLDAKADTLANLCREFDEANLTCDVVAAYTDFAPARAAELPHVETQIGYVESLARAGAALGARIVRVFTAYDSVAGHDMHALWRTVAGAIREICDRVEPLGMTVAIQNHHDLAVETRALLELLRDVDRKNCGLGFDAWSPALRGEDVYLSAKLAAPHAVLTTNADYVRLPRYQYRPAFTNYEPVSPDWVRAVPFGTGDIDYVAFFHGLRDGGFQGIAAYEMCSPLRGGGELTNLDAYARKYLEWMSEHVPESLVSSPTSSNPIIARRAPAGAR